VLKKNVQEVKFPENMRLVKGEKDTENQGGGEAKPKIEERKPASAIFLNR